MPPPGGDVIGRRRLDPHLDAFRALGATVEGGRSYKITRARRRPARLRLLHGRAVGDGHRERPDGRGPHPGLDRDPQRGVGAPRPGPRAPAAPDGRPHRGDRLERADRARRVHPRRRRLRDRPRLHRDRQLHRARGLHRRRAAGQERGGRRPAHDRLAFERLGCRIEYDGDDVVVPAGQTLRVKDDEGDAISKIEDGPWPAFPADLTSIALALATQAEGMVLIHEKMFENRLFFVDKLVSMGARVIVCDPHRAVVSGPSRLHGGAHGEPGHPGRHGDAHRRAVRRGHARRSATSARSTAATSGSTSACGRWARGSSGSPPSPSLSRGRPMIHPIPPGTRDVLPDEMRELRAISRGLRRDVRGRGLRRGVDAVARVRGGAADRGRRMPRVRASARSTSRATCWRCART